MKGIVHAHRNNFSLEQRIHLAKTIKRHNCDLLIWNLFSWESSYNTAPKKRLKEIAKLSDRIKLWVGMKPGDHRYCSHPTDRKAFRKNAKAILDAGAHGIYMPMDDTHPANDARPLDGEFHAKLIHELYGDIGKKLRGICGERYHGDFLNDPYYEPILNILPKKVRLTWTGPRVWNNELGRPPKVGWPLILWDNFFCNDSKRPERQPLYALTGRTKETKKVDTYVFNINPNYAWQHIPIYTALDFLGHRSYDPKKSMKKALKVIKCKSRDHNDMLNASQKHWDRRWFNRAKMVYRAVNIISKGS